MDNPLKSAVATVEVLVKDLNDNAPTFELEDYNMTVVENLPRGYQIMRFEAHDDDRDEQNRRFVYTLEDASGAFSIDPVTGTLALNDPSKLDREKQADMELVVSTRESRQREGKRIEGSNAVRVRVKVEDDNDNGPVFLPGKSFHVERKREKNCSFERFDQTINNFSSSLSSIPYTAGWKIINLNECGPPNLCGDRGDSHARREKFTS